MTDDHSPATGSNPPPGLTLPDTVQQQLQPLLQPGERLVAGAESDMLLPSRFGTAWLVGTARRIAVFTAIGEAPACRPRPMTGARSPGASGAPPSYPRPT